MGGGGVWSETAWGGFLGGDDKQQEVFLSGFFWVKSRGGRIGGGGGCVHCGVLCWFWAEGAHWCLAGALRFWVAMCVRHGRVRSYLFLIKFLEASLEFRLLLNWFSQVLTHSPHLSFTFRIIASGIGYWQ